MNAINTININENMNTKHIHVVSREKQPENGMWFQGKAQNLEGGAQDSLQHTNTSSPALFFVQAYAQYALELEGR